jgi:DNA-binding IscR family transcriptional regulator
VAANSRMTVAVHALAWMALAGRRGHGVLTSAEVAASVNTNPVIIRRCLGDLRAAGLVRVRHGTGAGWSLACPPEDITLLQVHDAIAQEPPFGLHASEPNPECPVGKGIRPALSRVYAGIEQTMRRELSAVSVADVLRDTLRAR